MPVTSVVGACNPTVRKNVADLFDMANVFRLYTTEDIRGLELCGVLKQVYAIAVGMCDGLGFPASTRASLKNRCLVEMRRILEFLRTHCSCYTELHESTLDSPGGSADFDVTSRAG